MQEFDRTAYRQGVRDGFCDGLSIGLMVAIGLIITGAALWLG